MRLGSLLLAPIYAEICGDLNALREKQTHQQQIKLDPNESCTVKIHGSRVHLRLIDNEIDCMYGQMLLVTDQKVYGPYCKGDKRKRRSWDGFESWGSDDDSWGSNWDDWDRDFFGDNEVDAVFMRTDNGGMSFKFDFNFEFELVGDSDTLYTTSVPPSTVSSTEQTMKSTTKSTTKLTTKQTTKQTTARPTTNPTTRPYKTTKKPRPTKTPPRPDVCVWADKNVFNLSGDCKSIQSGLCNLKHFEKCGEAMLKRLPDVCRYNDAIQVMPQIVQKIWPLGIEYEKSFRTKCKSFDSVQNEKVSNGF